MSVSYLSQQGSAVFGANRTAEIILKPDTGQYWLPTVVHVSTRISTNDPFSPIPFPPLIGPSARVTVSTGGIASLADPITVRDFTFQGQNDTSSILSGTVIFPGEGIRFLFTNGVPGDIAFADVAGLSSTEPPAIGIIPNVPGARFIGAQSLTLSTDLPLFINSTGVTVNVGASTSSGLLDMRNYSAYYVALAASSNTSPPTGFNWVDILLRWQDQPVITQFLWLEHYTIHARGLGGAFQLLDGAMFLQDIVHGPYLQVSIANNAGSANAMTVRLNVYASARVPGRPYIRQAANINAIGGGTQLTDTILISQNGTAIGAGVTLQFEFRMAPGLATLRFVAVTAAINFTFVAPNGSTIMGWALAAGADIHDQIVLPKSAGRLVVTNPGGVAGSFFANVTRAPESDS